MFWSIPVEAGLANTCITQGPTFYEDLTCESQPYMDDAVRTEPGISGDVVTVGWDGYINYVRFDRYADSETIVINSYFSLGMCTEINPIVRSRLKPAFPLGRFP